MTALDEILAGRDWVAAKMVARNKMAGMWGPPNSLFVEVVGPCDGKQPGDKFYPWRHIEAEIPQDRVGEVVALIQAVARRQLPPATLPPRRLG